MIRQLPQSEGATLGFEVGGKVTKDEELQWLKALEDAIGQHGKLRLLVVLDEKARWSIEAGIEDLRWAFKHMKHFDRLAIVSSSRVWKWLVTIDGLFAPLVGVGEKHFDISQLDDAWKWVRE